MQIGLNWKIALKWTFFINLNALKAIILCIFGVGMCPESLGQKKIFEIFFVTFTMESTTYKSPLTSKVVRCPPPLLEAPLLALAVLRLVLLLAGAVGVDLAHLAGVAGDHPSVPDTNRQHHHHQR